MKTQLRNRYILFTFVLLLLLSTLEWQKAALDDKSIQPSLAMVSTKEAPLATAILVNILQVPMSPTHNHVSFEEDTPEQAVQRTKSVTALLQKEAKVNIPDEEGKTPLMWACATGRTAIVDLLLQYGAAINLQDHEGETALHHAVWEEQREIVELLLKHHANLRLKDKYGNTPLHLTSLVHHYPPEIIRFLKQERAEALHSSPPAPRPMPSR